MPHGQQRVSHGQPADLQAYTTKCSVGQWLWSWEHAPAIALVERTLADYLLCLGIAVDIRAHPACLSADRQYRRQDGVSRRPEG